VQRNCASGLQALDDASKDIASGRCNLILAGGTDAMSRGPILFNNAMVDWLSRLNRSKTFAAKLKTFLAFRPHLLKPVIGLLCGLTDPICGLTMGQTAEIIAYDFGISRDMMDAYALRSHQRLAQAQAEHHLTEIVPIFDTKGNVYQADDGLRSDTTLAQLARLKPSYEKPYGTITAGNSSQVTDGAAFLILASEEAVTQHHLTPLAKVIDVNWGALSPSVMGLGPVHAIAPMMARNQLTLNDIDYFEINEAFAAQVLGDVAALGNQAYCNTHFGLDAIGTIDPTRLNIDGGAIAMGHPIGASGARIVLHLAQILKRTGAHRGIASLCIGGGQGGAMLIESL
jgi:acetyl-CoA C-acetyltransferase